MRFQCVLTSEMLSANGTFMDLAVQMFFQVSFHVPDARKLIATYGAMVAFREKMLPYVQIQDMCEFETHLTVRTLIFADRVL